jgi:hypothetical protein
VRRSIAILLASIFSLLLIVPAFAASESQSVPACCRKNGKHGCAMTSADSRDGKTSFSSLQAKCPYSGQFGVSAHHADNGTVPVFLWSGTELPSASAILRQQFVHRSGERFSDCLKRGPPSSFLA